MPKPLKKILFWPPIVLAVMYIIGGLVIYGSTNCTCVDGASEKDSGGSTKYWMLLLVFPVYLVWKYI